MKKIITAFLLLCLALSLFVGCGEGDGKGSNSKGDKTSKEPITVEADKTYYADIDIIDYGVITVKLDQSQAPITVQNFVSLAHSGFYDGLTFHRIISGFMMQGGDPNGNGTGDSGKDIFGEFSSNGHQNNISHKRGVISMARSNDPDSASCQFFIVHDDSAARSLDGKYAAFGHVTEGIEVVDKVCKAARPIDGNGTILKDNQPVIKTITIRVEDSSPIDSSDNDDDTSSETESDASEDTSSDSESDASKDTSSDSESNASTDETITIDPDKTYYATIDIVDYGVITVKLDQSQAPITVQNFVSLADSGFYNGLTFHRIISGFMMQGGDPKGNGTGGSGKKIFGEFSSNGHQNNISHKRGVISMARANDPNSASSQFFIVHDDRYSSSLDGKYAAFGYVTAGIEVVDKVCNAAKPIDSNGTIPKEDQPVIKSITITVEE